MVFYADTSALAKLVVTEAETVALRRWLSQDPRELVSCDLTRTELMRLVRRHRPELVVEARQVLDAITLLTLPTTDFEAAGRLDPATMRLLDALHLAAALDLGDDLDGFLTYDARQADAARAHGVAVVSPV